jgi:hypothetical protein
MMVYVVQNYLASFGLYPLSSMWKFYKRPQRFGDWIDLLSWARQKELVSMIPSLNLALSDGPN